MALKVITINKITPTSSTEDFASKANQGPNAANFHPVPNEEEPRPALAGTHGVKARINTPDVNNPIKVGYNKLHPVGGEEPRLNDQPIIVPGGAGSTSVYDRDLASKETGYPKIYLTLERKTLGLDMPDSDKVKTEIETVLDGWVKTEKMSEASALKIKKEVTGMLDSNSSGRNIDKYPDDIYMENILIKTWGYLISSTNDNQDRQNNAIGVLFEQVENASELCDTGRASRILQSLCRIYPNDFPEPIPFDTGRDIMTHFSKGLIKEIVNQKNMLDEDSIELSIEQIDEVKVEFLQIFHNRIKQDKPSISDVFIQKYIEDFVEPAFEGLVGQALDMNPENSSH